MNYNFSKLHQLRVSDVQPSPVKEQNGHAVDSEISNDAVPVTDTKSALTEFPVLNSS